MKVIQQKIKNTALMRLFIIFSELSLRNLSSSLSRCNFLASFFFLLLVTVLLSISAVRADVYLLKPNLAFTDLTSYLNYSMTPEPSYYFSQGGDKKALQIRVAKEDDKNTASPYYWARLDIANLSEQSVDAQIVPQKYYVYGTGLSSSVYGDFLIHNIHLVVDDESSPLTFDSEGRFDITMPPQSLASIIIRLEGDSLLPLAIGSAGEISKNAEKKLIFASILVGFLLFLITVSLALFFFRCDLIYLPLCLPIFAAMAIIAAQGGLLALFFELDNIERRIFSYFTETFYATSVLLVMFGIVVKERGVPAKLIHGCYAMLAVGTAAVILSLFDQKSLFIPLRLFSLAAPILAFAIICYGAFIGRKRCQMSFVAFLLIAFHDLIRILFGFSKNVFANGDIIMTITLVAALSALVIAMARLSFDALRYAVLTGAFGRKALALIGSNITAWQWHIESDVVSVDKTLAQALGLSKSAFANCDQESFIKHIHPLDREEYEQKIAQVLAQGGTHFAFEFRLRNNKGDYQWFELRGRGIARGHSYIEQCVGVIKDVTSSKKMLRKWIFDAQHDELTGFPNLVGFKEQLSMWLKRIEKKGDAQNNYVALLNIELKRIKHINNAFGYDIGANIVSQFARLVDSFVFENGIRGRLSDSNFALALALSSQTIEDCQQEIDKLCTEILAKLEEPLLLKPLAIFVDCYIGVSLAEADINIKQIMLNADSALIALHDNRAQGRYCIYQEQYTEFEYDDLSREMALRQAIDKDEMRVFYQPIINLSDGSIAGFEALIRWQYDEKILNPGSFLPITERAGISNYVGRFVLEKSIEALADLRQSFPSAELLFMSVNLANSQIDASGLIDDIQQFTAANGVEASSLILEISENFITDDLEKHLAIFAEIKNSGVKLALDDFGDGNTSLTYLQDLPIDLLKISGKFLQSTSSGGVGAQNRQFLTKVISLLNETGFTIIVEGLENAEDIEDIKKTNCDYAQGFIFGKPMAMDKLLEFMQEYEDCRRDSSKDFWQEIETSSNGG